MTELEILRFIEKNGGSVIAIRLWTFDPQHNENLHSVWKQHFVDIVGSGVMDSTVYLNEYGAEILKDNPEKALTE